MLAKKAEEHYGNLVIIKFQYVSIIIISSAAHILNLFLDLIANLLYYV